ncbi:MAG: T9SS type A sorting domain-containing protein, partial [Bacteroidetes bacterium]|nr:T9SS type A sorting domain-containing protein [Bacteroidota bacterium]
VTLTPGFASTVYNEYWKIWIDFNQNGNFSDAGELAFDAGALSSSTVSGNLNVPSTASLGTTRMRVSMKYNGAQTACETFSYGEVEDYSVNIIAPCPVPGGLDALNITSNSATLKWSSTDASGHDVRIRATGAPTWSTFSTTNTSISATGLSPATTYEFQVRSACSSSNSAYSGSFTFTTLNAGGAYCSSQGNDASYEWIAGVTVASIDNNTASNGGYADFTGISTNLEQGSSNAVTLTPGFSSSTYDEYWKIWIDLNQDGDFSDAGELVFDATGLSSATITKNLDIPLTATLGTTRMRVSMKYNGAQTACETFAYGEVEDYTVDIASAKMTSVSNIVKDVIDFNLYPNPTQNASVISFSIPIEAHSVVLNIYDLQGKLVHTNSWNGRDGEVKTTLSFDDLPGGVYQVSLQAGEFYGVKRLVVVK